MICCEMLPPGKFVETTHWTGHDICKTCAAKYLHTEVMGNGKTSILCPSSDCAVVLEYEEIRRISDSETFARCYYKIHTLNLVDLTNCSGTGPSKPIRTLGGAPTVGAQLVKLSQMEVLPSMVFTKISRRLLFHLHQM